VEHGGEVLRIAKNLGLNPKEILDFSSNTNPLGPPNSLLESINKAMDLLSFYPDEDYLDFRRALSDYLGVSFKEVIEANGATELIHIFTNLAKENSKAIIPIPTFSEYEKACRKLKVTFVALEEGLEGIIKEVEDFSLIFLCNPNNPDSHLFEKQELYELLKKVEDKKAFLLIDESFLPFLLEEEDYTLVKEVRKYKRLLIVRSLTKFFCLPGVRVGFGVAHEDLIKEIRFIKPSWSLNCFAERICIDALKDQEYIEKTKALISREKDYLYEEIKRIHYPYKPKANFLLVRLKGIKSNVLKDKLIKRRILIRDCSNIRGLNQEYIRISVRCREDNEKLIREMEEIMKYE